MTNEATWMGICTEATTEEERTWIGESEDNAHATAYDDGFAPFSEAWYGNAITTYEFLSEQ